MVDAGRGAIGKNALINTLSVMKNNPIGYGKLPVGGCHGLPQHHHDRARQARGKPCIRGMRITVYDVLDYIASGMTQEEILKDFPYLTAEDIQACLRYAADRERQQLASNA